MQPPADTTDTTPVARQAVAMRVLLSLACATVGPPWVLPVQPPADTTDTTPVARQEVAMGGMARFGIVLWLAASGVGCCSCGPKVGWSFQVGRPASITGEALVQPSITSYSAVGGIATLPALGGVMAAHPACISASGVAALTRPAAADPCAGMSLEELCQRLLRIEAILKKQAQPMPRPVE